MSIKKMNVLITTKDKKYINAPFTIAYESVDYALNRLIEVLGYKSADDIENIRVIDEHENSSI